MVVLFNIQTDTIKEEGCVADFSVCDASVLFDFFTANFVDNTWVRLTSSVFAII